MRKMMLLAAVAGLFAATTTAAGAETPAAAPAPAAQPAAAVDPVKLALAHELIEATGGRKAAETRLRTMFGHIGDVMKPFTNDKTEAMAAGFGDDLGAVMIPYVPQILEATANAYATVYSEQELRDYLAWLKSPSGQSVAAKAPEIQTELLQTTMPIIQQMTGDLVHKMMDRICTAKSCTPEQRRQAEAIMSKVMGQPK